MNKLDEYVLVINTDTKSICKNTFVSEFTETAQMEYANAIANAISKRVSDSYPKGWTVVMSSDPASEWSDCYYSTRFFRFTKWHPGCEVFLDGLRNYASKFARQTRRETRWKQIEDSCRDACYLLKNLQGFEIANAESSGKFQDQLQEVVDLLQTSIETREG